jgi:hypothetical protein
MIGNPSVLDPLAGSLCGEGMIQNPEQAFREMAEAKGWDVTKRGWPDFLCRRNGELMAVEVKGPRDGLSPQQYETISDLRRVGIPTFVWGPDTGFTEVGPPVGESVFMLKAMIAQLREVIDRLRTPRPMIDSTVVQWAFAEEDLKTVEAVRVWCLHTHSGHKKRKVLGTSGSWCSDAAILARTHSSDQILAMTGMPNVGMLRKTLEQIHEFMVNWQHERLHRSIGVAQACTGCAHYA